MATKSIYKQVKIKDRRMLGRFVTALEKAEKASERDITLSKNVQIMDRSQIKKIFGDSDN
jgi:putative protein kinase ArgK-like GTPase of G3E family